MYPIPVAILLIAALSFFAYSIFKRYQLLAMAKPTDRFDRIGTRIKGLFKYGIGQDKMISKDFWPGLLHAFIFWGFCVVSLETIIAFGAGFKEGFTLPFF